MCETEIMVLGKKYGFKVKLIHHDLALVETPLESFMISEDNTRERPFLLKHFNEKGNKKRKHIFHVQHDFRDLPWCFLSISTHNDPNKKINKKNSNKNTYYAVNK